MALGFIRSSPSDIEGNSTGSPPSARTPSLTKGARSRSARLHGFRSLAELEMPITGRSAARVTSMPDEASATRWATATSSSPANHALPLRSVTVREPPALALRELIERARYPIERPTQVPPRHDAPFP